MSIRLGRLSLCVMAVLAVGIAFKTLRYASGPGPSEQAAIDWVTRFMAAQGWALSIPTSSRAGDLYRWVEFKRPDCATALVVAFLTGNAEGADLVKLDHHGDVAFVQGGQIVSAPSGLHRQLSSVSGIVQRAFGLPAPREFPVMAVSPAPDPDTTGCKGPAASTWRQ